MKRGDPGYWEWRKNVGKPKAIKTPEKLWELACEYFDYIDSSPWKKEELIKSGDMVGAKFSTDKPIPYTWGGLAVYLDEKNIIGQLDDYKLNTGGNYTEFQGVILKIGRAIRTQKFEGAAAGFFQHNIIAYDLGLVKKVDHGGGVIIKGIKFNDETEKE